MTDSNDWAKLRILVVDDEELVLSSIRESISDSSNRDRVQVYTAGNEAEALKIFSEHYLDVIFLDLHFSDGDLGGYAILETLGSFGCSANIILMTHYELDTDGERLIQSISRLPRPRVIDFIKKDELARSLPDILDALLTDFDAKRVDVRNLDFAVGLIANRRDRYSDPEPSLRGANDEVGVEVERLCRDLFGSVEGPNKSTNVSVELLPLERRGLSAAVTLKPVVHLGFHGVPSTSPGYECVLKIGPVEDIRQELARYQEYVRYGVQLEQRVELLAAAFRDGVGGIVYSFAGGVYGQALVSFDELLRENKSLSSEVVSSLFSSVNWYSVAAVSRPIRDYIDSSYKVNLAGSIKRNLTSLRNLEKKYPEVDLDSSGNGPDSAIRVGDAARLAIPGERSLGEGWCMVPSPWCLVHGDMHGGNVMVELSGPEKEGPLGEANGVRRVCLIDYRNSGPGPRCIDAIALEASIRIADAEEISAKYGSRNARTLKGQDLVKAMQDAARRVDAERQLYQYIWGKRGRPLSAGWASLAADVVGGIMHNFQDAPISPAEYLQTGMLYSIRQLAYPLDSVARVRICAWLAAQYSLFRRNSDLVKASL